MFNRDKEKKFFKADQISMKTTKQQDFQGEQVPYERVKSNRPATSYGPFTASTSYGHTFQGWDTAGSYVPALVPKGNLQSTTNVPFRATSAYRDTFKSGNGGRPGSGGQNQMSVGGANNMFGMESHGAGDQGIPTNNALTDPNKVYGGANRNQKSQISILSSPDKKMPFHNETTNRAEFRGQKTMERARPIRHLDNLGNLDMKMDPSLYNTSYRNNYNDFSKEGPCKREEERVTVRRGLKQLQ